MGFFGKIFGRKEKKRVVKKDDLKRLALLKISKIEKKKFSDKSLDEFMYIFKVFIIKKLGLKKGATTDEIIAETDKKRIKKDIKNKIISISSEIDKIEFADKKIESDEFKQLIKDFKEIIKFI